MRYQSTRGGDRDRTFIDILLAGLASDGGLYVPDAWPQVTSAGISAMAGRPYAEVAGDLLIPFVEGEIPETELRRMCAEAYRRFTHEDVAPLRELGSDHFLLELFHGPTLAFKDVALQLLGQLFDFVLSQRQQRLTIIGATSGDTGGAAIEALKGLENVSVFILHPEGRISATQRRMMTTVSADNIHNIAVEGTFDDCQALVKQMFADQEFRTRINMGAINSINWARIMAQIVYYFTSAAALGAPGRQVSYVVPTGNFGDIFAGYAAHQMGLPVAGLGIATNTNDILRRTVETGVYEPSGTVPTVSPSMDIQVSSNFERLLYECGGRDPELVTGLMDDLATKGMFQIAREPLAHVRSLFCAASSDEQETRDKIRQMSDEYGLLVDPHTAVGLVATDKLRESAEITGPVVTLATAHPAKFPDAVAEAAGIMPQLPEAYADLFDREECCSVLPNDAELVQTHILDRV